MLPSVHADLREFRADFLGCVLDLSERKPGIRRRLRSLHSAATKMSVASPFTVELALLLSNVSFHRRNRATRWRRPFLVGALVRSATLHICNIAQRLAIGGFRAATKLEETVPVKTCYSGV
jgi:hypothetical protein